MQPPVTILSVAIPVLAMASTGFGGSHLNPRLLPRTNPKYRMPSPKYGFFHILKYPCSALLVIAFALVWRFCRVRWVNVDKPTERFFLE